MKSTSSEKTENKIIVTVNGLDIKEGSFYKVLHKPDTDKENGFTEEGATKLPTIGISDVFQCRFVNGFGASGNGVWDNGLYAESPCYAKMDEKEVKAIVKSLKENIVDPYERKYGKDKLNHENDAYWANEFFVVQEGQIYDMSDVEQRLALYMAMRCFKLTPIELVNDLRFKGSSYCVQDESKVRNRKMDKIANEMRAINIFTTYSSTNVNLLKAIMSYVGFNAFSSDADEYTRMGMFGNWLRADGDNVQKFLETVDIADDKSTTDILFLYHKLPLAIKKKIIERSGGVYYHEDKTIGGDLKTVARVLNSNPEFEELKTQILELD